MRFLIITLAVLLTSSISFAQNKTIALDDIIHYTFDQKEIRINSLADGIHFAKKDQQGTKILKFSYKTGKEVGVILDLKNIEDCPIDDFSAFEFSPNENKVLLMTNKKKIYRHSFTAQYYIYDFYTKKIEALSEDRTQRVPIFSPNEERIAYVSENNIYIKTFKFGTTRKVTSDGKTNEVLNGIPDWVYEEEFAFTRAMEWSPDSKVLAFVKYDEREVQMFSFPMYKGLSPVKNNNDLYPGTFSLKYPKAGEKNSTVSVHTYELENKITMDMKIGDETDIYIPKIAFNPDGENLVIFRVNRQQNRVDLLYANAFTGDTHTAMTEKNKRYIAEDFYHQFTYLDDGLHFVLMSERNGWSHLYLYKNNGFLVKQITNGEFDVTDFYGYDVKKKTFYYQAAKTSPLNREVYGISLDEKKAYTLSDKEGTTSANFSKTFAYTLLNHQDLNTPVTCTIKELRKFQTLYSLEENEALITKIEGYDLPTKEFFTFTTTNGDELNGVMYKPSNFEANKKYPVIMHQYSGPNSQKVVNSFAIGRSDYFAQQGFLYVIVDGRGTAARGEEFRKCTYKQLGNYESVDQVETAKYLGTLPYVDQEKIAIWGWSYGGFNTLLSLSKGGKLFKAGVAVAPVTNWKYYDSAYTERFMDVPSQNPDGYWDNSPISMADKIKSPLLIMHGTADENVHVQNTYEYCEALVQAGVQFEMQIYTNRAHGISGGNTRKHLYTRILNFFERELK